MIHSVGRARDSLHESECQREILEFEDAVEISFHHAPAIDLAQSRCNPQISRSTRAAAGRTTGPPNGEPSDCTCLSGGPAGSTTGTSAVARSSATRNAEVYAEARILPGLWRKTETSRRRCLGDAGICAGAFQSHPAGSPETGLRESPSAKTDFYSSLCLSSE